VLTRRGVVRPRSRPRRVSGAATISACNCRWASLAAWTADRRGQPHRQCGTVTGGAGLGELVAAQRLTGRPDRVQGVGLGPVAGGGPLGPVQLHHLLGVSVEEAGEASAVAASTLNRPHALAQLAGRHLEQLLVADRGGRHGHLLDHRAADCLNDRRGVGVLVGVDPDGRARRGLPA
jgi:hypothetical protein